MTGPRFVYEEARLYDAFTGLRAALADQFAVSAVAYAVKCNPLPQILCSLVGWGAWLEVAWPREVTLARDAGVDPARLLWGGPYRSADVYKQAGGLGARLAVESLQQLRDALEVAGLRVCLRVKDLPTSRFGLPAEHMGRTCAMLAAAGAGEVAVQVHSSGDGWPPQPAAWHRRAEVLAATARELTEHGITVPLLSLGGGLPEPDVAQPGPGDFTRSAMPLLAAAAEVLVRQVPDARIVVEPGRFLVQHSGSFLARVLDVRTERGRTSAVLDAGVCSLASMTSSTGGAAILGGGPGDGAEVELLGPSNREDDRLGWVRGTPAVGDVIRFDRVGAYQQAFSCGFAEDIPGADWVPRQDGCDEQLTASIEADVLAEADRIPGAADRKIDLVLTGRSFVAVRLDDGSVGTAMDYSRYPKPDGLETPVADDPALVELFGRCGLLAARSALRMPAAELGHQAQAVKIATMAALSRPAMAGESLAAAGLAAVDVSYEDERARSGRTPARAMLERVLDGASVIGVVGFGGFMEMIAEVPAVRTVLVTDLHAAHRSARIIATLRRLNARHPLPKIEFVGDRVDRLVDECEVVQLTASALCNGTADDLLAMFGRHPAIMVGPSGAIAPAVWFRRNIRLVCTELRDARYVQAYRYDDHLYEWFSEYAGRTCLMPIDRAAA